MLAKRIRSWVYDRDGRKLPFRNPPLRAAGQTLIEKHCDEYADLSVLIIMCCTALFGYGLLGLLLQQGKPWPSWVAFYSVGFVGAVVGWFAVRGKLNRRRDQVRNYWVGLIGEQVIGQQLERCRALGYSVFHDILSEDGRGNIDHIAIGPAGILVVETKARSHGAGVDAKVRFTQREIEFAGNWSGEAPVKQAHACVAHVNKVLEELVRKDGTRELREFYAEIPRIPIIAVPGWSIDFKNSESGPLAVTNEEKLVDYVSALKSQVPPEPKTELAKLFGAYLRKREGKRLGIESQKK